MRKTRKLGKLKQVKRKHKSKRLGSKRLGSKRLGPKRLGRGLEERALPFLLKEKLNDTSLRSHNQTFNEPMLVSQILQDVPRDSVTLAIKNAPYKEEVARLLSKKLNQSANSRGIASKIVSAVPTTHITIGRKKQDLIKELRIAQAALDAHIVKSQPIRDYTDKAFDKVDELGDKYNALEKAIGYSKLEKYDNLESKYNELTKSESMLERSRASIIKAGLEASRHTSFGKQLAKLRSLRSEADEANKILDIALVDRDAAYDEQERLTLIVNNLKKQLEDLEDP
jgi:hypothetical protein